MDRLESIKYIGTKRNTVVRENAGVPYISYEALEHILWLTNGFSTRMGGVSQGIYASMNLNFNVQDDEKNVLENFRRIGMALDIPVEKMVFSQQTHTTNVMVVDETNCGMGILCDRNFHDIDGIVTNVPGVCLVTSYADCVPLYFVDPIHRAIGLSHSGWRGTVGNIAKNTIELMKKTYGTAEKDLIVCIGPSICKNCYEVSEDVAEKFISVYNDGELVDILAKKQDGKYLLDLPMACRYNFINSGILEEHIIMPDLCTCCNDKILFSHRASKGKRGGLCAFLAIKE